MSKNFEQYKLVASGTVVGATGALLAGGGPAGAVPGRTSAGLFTLTLPGSGIAEAECFVQVTPKGTIATGNVQPPAVVHTSNTVKTIRLTVNGADGGTLTDLDFMFAIFRGYNRS